MRRLHLTALSIALASIAFSCPAEENTAITFKKVVLDEKFRSEGVAVADVDKDGKLDVLAGEVWYKAPDWTMHEIDKPGTYDGSKGYSNSFANFTDDLNGDGYDDFIVISFPGMPASWYENPKGKTGQHWKKHVIWHSACNESPQYRDLLGTGHRQLLMGWQPPGKEREGLMSFFTPASSPTKLWKEHPVSGPNAPGTFKYAHGLGVGDVNGDGRNDVIITNGWWEAPKDRMAGPWKYHDLGNPDGFGKTASDMYAYDVDGDGLNDIISSSAHAHGIRWFKQVKTDKGSEWKRHLIDESYSQTHSMHLVDMNGDGAKDLVTGKRYFAHQGRDPGGKDPVVLHWYELKRGDSGVRFIRHDIAMDVGVGTQFEVSDMNGDKKWDIVVSNKKGVQVVIQN